MTNLSEDLGGGVGSLVIDYIFGDFSAISQNFSPFLSSANFADFISQLSVRKRDISQLPFVCIGQPFRDVD